MTFVILLVDDNFDHRFLAKRALKPLEADGAVRVEVAEDGEQALAKLRGGLAPSLVLLDIKMPRKDGFEVLSDIRADAATARLPVVMLTSSENRVDIERARTLGADDYMTKPLDAKDFQEKVRALVAAWLAKGLPPG
ncbi:MAG TPA: response regulator [Candidatus Thermoplasmatota archaeon]|nr:response regulator [Candidatus Thermoplasmatota archaeon]